MNFYNFFLLFWVIFALLDPDPDPLPRLNPDPVMIRIRNPGMPYPKKYRIRDILAQERHQQLMAENRPLLVGPEAPVRRRLKRW
jgi:hypothetical protein